MARRRKGSGKTCSLALVPGSTVIPCAAMPVAPRRACTHRSMATITWAALYSPALAGATDAVGYPDPVGGTNPAKRMRLKEACTRNGSGTVNLFCDEAQRYDENEYEWQR